MLVSPLKCRYCLERSQLDQFKVFKEISLDLTWTPVEGCLSRNTGGDSGSKCPLAPSAALLLQGSKYFGGCKQWTSDLGQTRR